MNIVDRPKRTPPTTSQTFTFKRAKTEHCDAELGSPLPLPLSALQGVERIRLPHLRRLSSQYLEQLAGERTATLRGQGRHVVGLPLVLDDGIILNWVRKTALLAEHKNEARPLVSFGRGSGTSAADAIIIDSDEDISIISSHSRTVASGVSYSTSSSQGAIAYPDLDTASLPFPHLERIGQSSTHVPLTRELPYSGGVAEPTPSTAPSDRALIQVEDVATLAGHETSGTTSGSEVDTTDEVLSKAVDVSATPLPSPQLARDTPINTKRPAGLHPDGTVATPQVSRKQSGKEFVKEATTHSSSTTDEEADFQVSDPRLKRVPLPKTVHGRARRLLKPDSTDLPLVAITMRGDCHFIERKKKYRITGYSLPNPGVFRHVSDVCMVGNTAILGCDKGTNQISFLSVAGKPQMVNVACSPHSSGPRYQDTQRRGVTCLAAIHAKDGHIKFLSGGYDGTVHKWMAGVEKLDEPRFEKVISYGACIMALAYRDHDRSVVASVQKTLHITDLNRQRTKEYAFSNDIQQIHIHPQAPCVTLLEVRHLDHQIQLYDSRKANFDTEPCSSFGYRNPNCKFPATHTRGSVHLIHFAKASEDGCVLLWDFRNTKRAMVERRFQQAENAVHTIFVDRDIATFGQGVVTFFEDYLIV